MILSVDTLKIIMDIMDVSNASSGFTREAHAGSAGSVGSPAVILAFDIVNIICDVLKLPVIKTLLGAVIVLAGLMWVGAQFFKGLTPEWAQQQQGKLGAAFLFGIGLVLAAQFLPDVANKMFQTTFQPCIMF